MITGYYSLNKNFDIALHNPDCIADLRENDDVLMLWPKDDSNREWAWRLLIESIACGADKNKINEIAEKWQCDDADAEIYAERIGVVLLVDGASKMAVTRSFTNIQESYCGFGETNLEAMADLCVALGYVPQKMCGATFTELVNKV